MTNQPSIPALRQTLEQYFKSNQQPILEYQDYNEAPIKSMDENLKEAVNNNNIPLANSQYLRQKLKFLFKIWIV